LKDNVKVWDDVFDTTLDERLAPSLWEVYFNKTHSVYSNSFEFFKRTYLSSAMNKILNSIVSVLSSRGGRNVYPLYSLYGGGKTHTLITIYHAIKSPKALEIVSKDLAIKFMKIADKVRLVILDCDSEELVPSPMRPLNIGSYSVHTIWGALAHQLGRYDDLRSEDETRVPPTVDRLKRLLGSRPTVILMDEVVKYASRFEKSSNKELRDYSKAIIVFIENLAKAVSDTNSVLIITLPIKVKKTGETFQIELFEEPYISISKACFRAIGRVTSTYDIPLTPNDVVEVLKKRIFERIDENAKSIAQSEYLGIYSSDREIFGEYSIREGGKIAQYYPYHPAYINILYDIVNRVPELEKTRDALRITRKIVRSIWRSKEDYDLIMPWHIDLRNEEIKNLILTPEFRAFDAVVNRDLFERIGLTANPSLAYIIALSIFLKTYVYGKAIKAEKMFPTREEISFYTFEKSIFEEMDCRAVDIYDLIEELKNVSYYLQEEGGRYWFTPIVSVIELVEEEAKRVNRDQAFQVLVDNVKKLLVKTPDQILQSSRVRRVFSPQIYNPALARVIDRPEPPEMEDTREYILFVSLSTLDNDSIYRLLYQDSQGRMRTYRNTVTITYPDREENINRLLEYAKKWIACEKVSKELDTYYLDKDIKEIQTKKLKDYQMNHVFKYILRNAVTAFNMIAYPTYDFEKQMEWFETTRTKMATLSIISLVEDTLSEKDVGKIARDLNFEGLNFMLETKLGINLVESNHEIPVSELINYFFTNPRLPFTKTETILECIREGVENLDIGIRKGDEIYWKRVYSAEESIPMSDRGNVPSKIDEFDLIIPWRLAARQQMKNLLELDGKVIQELENRKRIIRIILRTDSGDFPIRKIAKMSNFEVLVKEGILIRKEEVIREDINISFSEEEVVVNPGEIVSVEVKVMPIGEVSSRVEMKVDQGSLEPDKGEIPLTSMWRMQAPSEPGVYEYGVEVYVEKLDKTIRKNLVITVKKRKEEIIVSGKEVEKYTGFEITRAIIEDYMAFDSLVRLIGKKVVVENGRAEVFLEDSSISLNFRNIDPEIMRQMIKDSKDYLGYMQAKVGEFRAEVKAVEPIILDDQCISEFRGLEGIRLCLVRKKSVEVDEK